MAISVCVKAMSEVKVISVINAMSISMIETVSDRVIEPMAEIVAISVVKSMF
jgi:hypothetical protein